MKCDKCNNEANFHYQSNVNGEKTEYHLCPECAEKEGFGEMMSLRPRSMMRSFFNEPFMGMLTSPFGGFGGFEGFFGRTAIAPKDETNVQIEEPSKAENSAPTENVTKEAAEKKDNIPETVCDEYNKRRQIAALRYKMKAAIITEDFEEAAKLRDEIKELQK